MKTNIYLFCKKQVQELEQELGKFCAQITNDRFPTFTPEMHKMQGALGAYQTIINLMED